MSGEDHGEAVARFYKDEEYRIVDEPEEQMVSRIFAMVGKEHGIEASAVFAPFDNLKFRWCGFGAKLNPRLVPEGRTGSITRVRFEVSDYLQDAPESVLESIARTVILRFLKHDSVFSEETIRWLSALEFSEKHRSLYLTRRDDVGSEDGEHKSLQEAVDRLVEKGLVDRDPSIMIVWSKGKEMSKSAWSASAMRVVCVNKVLDSDDVPDEVLDQVILRHLVHIRNPIFGDRARLNATVTAIVSKCPGYDRTVEWLKENRLTF